MLETNGSVIFVFIHVRLDLNGIVCDEILSFVLGLIHVKYELDVFAFGECWNKKIDRTLGHNHYMLTTYCLEVSLDREAGLVKLLLS